MLWKNILETSDIPLLEREGNQIQVTITRSKSEVADNEKTCFACQEQRININGTLVDNGKYNKDGLERSSGMTGHLLNNDASGDLNSTVKRLKVALCGPKHDNFALNAYYYQSCYLIFTLILKMSQSMYSSVNENEEIVSVEFCTYVKINILREKNA